jgi:O-antigen/teichoic acid export membrane protein
MIVWSIAVNALFGAHRTARYAAHSLGLAVVSGVAVVAVGLGHRVTAVLVAWAAAQVVAALVAFVDVARLSGRHPSSTSRRALLSYGTRAQASNLVTFLNYRLDVLLVVALASTAEAGRYAAVVVLAEGLWFVSMVAGTVLFPRVAAEADEVRRRDLTELVARLTWWATAITAVIAALLAGPLLRVVFGRSMEVASGAFRVTLIGVTLLAMARVLANYTAGVGRPGLNAVGSLLALGVNVALNFALIPRHGITGAATATAISYGVLTAYQLVVYARIGSPGRVPLGLFLPRSGDIVALRGAVAGFRNGD